MRTFSALVSLPSHQWLSIEKGEPRLNLFHVCNRPCQLSAASTAQANYFGSYRGSRVVWRDINTLPFSVKTHAYATRRLVIFDRHVTMAIALIRVLAALFSHLCGQI